MLMYVYFWCRHYLNEKMKVYLMALFSLANSKTSQTFFSFILNAAFPYKKCTENCKKVCKKPVRSTGLHILSKNYAKKMICSSLIFTEFQFHGTGWTQKKTEAAADRLCKKVFERTSQKPSSIYSWFLKTLSVLHSRFPTKKS